MPTDVRLALRWVARASRPLADLMDPAVMRSVLTALRLAAQAGWRGGGGVLDHTDAADALVVGHSGGGFAALSYVVSGARPPRALLLLGTAAHDQDTPDSEVRMMGSRLFSWALSRPALGRRLLGQTMGKRVDPQVP